MGGLHATFSKRAPQVAFYSSRGPDLANNERAVAEVMKPNAMAPGDMIWAAWSPLGNDDDDFAGNLSTCLLFKFIFPYKDLRSPFSNLQLNVSCSDC